MSDTNEREEFGKWCGTVPLGAELDNVDMLPSDALEAAWVGYQAATLASDARYQARVIELEEALKSIGNDNHGKVNFGLIGKALSTTTPDTALQKALLEARIDEQRKFVTCRNDVRDRELRAQLAALESNETLGE